MNNKSPVTQPRQTIHKGKSEDSDVYSIYWKKSFHKKVKAFCDIERHRMSLSQFLHIAAVGLMRKWRKDK